MNIFTDFVRITIPTISVPSHHDDQHTRKGENLEMKRKTTQIKHFGERYTCLFLAYQKLHRC